MKVSSNNWDSLIALGIGTFLFMLIQGVFTSIPYLGPLFGILLGICFGCVLGWIDLKWWEKITAGFFIFSTFFIPLVWQFHNTQGKEIIILIVTCLYLGLSYWGFFLGNRQSRREDERDRVDLN